MSRYPHQARIFDTLTSTIRNWAFLLITTSAFVVSGCGSSQPGFTAVPSSVKISGTVYGGKQPISGSAIQIYAIGTTADGEVSIPLLAKSIITDGSGKFTIPPTYRCPSAQSQLYVVALGGYPPASGNPNAGLLSLLGSCADLSATTSVTLNEVTTLSAVSALSAFMNGYSKIGVGASSAAAFASALNTANQLADFSTGEMPGSQLTSGQLAPTEKMATLANILAACVDSPGGKGGDGGPCGRLFQDAPGLDGLPTNTVDAMVNIARNPTRNVAALYSIGNPSSPFHPDLLVSPADWIIAISSPIPAPVFSPAGGTYQVAQMISISDGLASTKIYYTTDGTTPTAASKLYAGAFPVTATTTVRAVAIALSLLSSTVTTAAYTIVPQPTQLAFETQPSSSVAGVAIAPALQVAVLDSQGNQVSTSGATVTLGLAANPAGAHLSGTFSVAAVNGLATFTDIVLDQAGSGYTLVATSAGLKSSTSAAFLITSPLPSEQARSADSLIDSIGINVHFSFYSTVYTNNSSQMITAIQQLGIRHLRDQMAWEGSDNSTSPFYAIHNKLGSAGIKTDFILTSIDYPMSQVEAYPSLVNDMEAAEATNEYDASGVATWAKDIKKQQASLYAQIHSAAASTGFTVISPSLAQPQNASQLGDVSNISNVGDSHAYFGGWNPGNSGTGGANNPAYFLRYAEVNNPNQSTWVTETGFWSVPGSYDGGYGISEQAMAIYSPRNILEFWNAGAARTYIYELADYSADVKFGLMRSDATARPAFAAMKNLLAVLNDPGNPFTPGLLSYSLQGGDTHIHHALFEKRDGSFYLAIWNEALSYDFTNQAAIAVPAQAVTLQLTRAPASMQSTQWDENGNVAVGQIKTAASTVVSVTDKLQIIEIIP